MKVLRRRVVHVEKIRYSQDSIVPYFKNSERSLEDVAQQILSGSLTPSDFPEMLVWHYGALYFTHGNGLLWILRRAKVKKVAVQILFPRPIDNQAFQESKDYRKYSNPNFSPVFRWFRVPEAASNSLPDTEKDRSGLRSNITGLGSPETVSTSLPSKGKQQNGGGRAAATVRRRSWNRLPPTRTDVKVEQEKPELRSSAGTSSNCSQAFPTKLNSTSPRRRSWNWSLSVPDVEKYKRMHSTVPKRPTDGRDEGMGNSMRWKTGHATHDAEYKNVSSRSRAGDSRLWKCLPTGCT